MFFGGIHKTSLIDYPGKISTVVFTIGCNFRCPFCHNPSVVYPYENVEKIPQQKVLEIIKERKEWIDGVVVTGGEPTMHQDLPEFFEKVKKIGLLAKLDTNGSNPEMLEKLVEKKLVDYVAMDYKAPIKKYGQVINVDFNKQLEEKIRQSAEFLLKNKVDYEFRTTIVPTLVSPKDVEKIAQEIKGAKKYALQQFVNKNRELVDKKFLKIKPYPDEKIVEIWEKTKKFFKKSLVRGTREELSRTFNI